MNITYGIMAGTDLPDGFDNIKSYGPDNGNYGAYAHAVRRAAQRQLYTVANSNAMNFIGDDTVMYTVDPAWWSVRDGLVITVCVVFGVSCAFLAATAAWTILAGVFSRRRSHK